MSKSTPVVTAAAKKPLTFDGTKLDTPVSPTAPQITLNNPQSIANSLTTATNQANAANNQRYGQGLGVLTGGFNNANGYISQALNNTNNMGNTARQQVADQYQNNKGQVAQDSASRGLGNTTIRDSMNSMAQRTFNQADNSIAEQVANQQNQLYGQQAQLATQGAGAVSNWIGQRNDQAPDLGQYTGLIQQALAAPSGTTRIQSGSLSGNSWQQPGNPQAYGGATMTGQNPTATIGSNGALNFMNPNAQAGGYLPAISGVNVNNGMMGSIQSAIGGVNAGALSSPTPWPQYKGTQVTPLQ